MSQICNNQPFMDSGALSVVGEKLVPLDPLVHEVVARIENFLKHSHLSFEEAKSVTEIEGRLGLICTTNQRDKSVSRLYLPVLSEMALSPSGSALGHNGKPFRYEFVPSLEKRVFDAISQRLEKLLELSVTGHKLPTLKVISTSTSHTMDEIYKNVSPDIASARLSFDFDHYYESNARPVEIVMKENADKIDVWSGHYPDISDEFTAQDEGAHRHPLDYRIAVNKEKTLKDERSIASVMALIDRGKCTLKREKRRTSFDMKAWVVDLTEVVSVGGNSLGNTTTTSYEIEAELKSDLLIAQLERKSQGKVHGTFQILNDFLIFIRDLCCVFGVLMNEAGSSGNSHLPDLTACEPSEDKKRKFREVTKSNVFPIIGDYIYNVLSELGPPG